MRRTILAILSLVAATAVVKFGFHGTLGAGPNPGFEDAMGASGFGASALDARDVSRLVRRGVPNDFWFNHQMSPDLGAACSGDNFVPGSGSLWYLQDAYMDVVRAWGIITSSNVGIVLCDQEVATPHYDLNDNIYRNPGEIPGNSIDDDGNSLVDDYMGWDYYSMDPRPYVNGVDDNFPLNVAEGQQHGTQMASVMGAVGNNEPWNGYPDYLSRRQGSVGVLWSVDILPLAILSISSKPDNRPYALFSGSPDVFSAEYAETLPGDFRVLSQSYVGQTDESAQAAGYYGMLLVAGAGNTNSTAATAFGTGRDYVVVVGAVLRSGKTGNRDPSSSGASDGSSSFSTGLAMVGYAAREGQYYNTGPGTWKDPSAVVDYPAFTLGYMPTTAPPPLDWLGNVDATGDPDEPVHGILPSPLYTSGATAQASALASMTWSLYPELTNAQVRFMMERGCVTDVYDGRNADQCDSGDCAGLLGAGRMSAYRTITLWGAVGDTILTGDVYLGGDVMFTGTTTLSDVTFHIAPQDLFQQEVTGTCQAQYEIDYGLFGTPDATLVCVYMTGAVTIPGGKFATFESNAEYPGAEDWGGLFGAGAGFSFTATGSLTVANTTGGEY